MTEEKMYRFLSKCKTQLELIADGFYQFEVRVNVKDEIQLRLSSSDADITIYTDWESMTTNLIISKIVLGLHKLLMVD